MLHLCHPKSYFINQLKVPQKIFTFLIILFWSKEPIYSNINQKSSIFEVCEWFHVFCVCASFYNHSHILVLVQKLSLCRWTAFMGALCIIKCHNYNKFLIIWFCNYSYSFWKTQIYQEMPLYSAKTAKSFSKIWRFVFERTFQSLHVRWK